MNVIIVDTSSWISYFNDDFRESHADVDLALKEGRVYLPPIVAAELLSSRLKTSERARLIDFLKELPLCEISFDHWSRVGELRARLAAKELEISTPDAHVAQCAIDLGGYLLSEDGVFKKVSSVASLRILEPGKNSSGTSERS